MTNEHSDNQARTALLLAALANVPGDELRGALARTPAAPATAGVAARNAWNALRRHRDPAAVFGRPQYRAALASVAASVADECLARTVDELGDHSEDPTREQLLDALDKVRASFSDTTVAVMLASVAYDDLPSSALCAAVLADDPRFGLAGADLAGADRAGPVEPGSVSVAPAATGAPGASPEQREARRAKKEKTKADRRRKAEIAQRADDQIRQRRKQDRARSTRSR